MKRPHWNKPAWKKPTWAGLKASLTTRAFRVVGYSVAAAAIVVFLAVVANILVNALPASVTQLDTTAGTLYTLSQETEDILDGLEQDVTIYWIVQSGQEDETLGTLLDRYAARSDYVTLETIDPDVSPNFLQEYVSGTVYNNSLIVESGDRNTYVSYEDIYEYSYSSDYSSYDVSFAGESSLTSAIDYVLSDTLPKLYTLTGHGEDDLSTSFQSAVEQQNIEVADLSLLTEESVPEDADCLLINGPDSDLSQDEAEAIQAYLDTGGDLIVLTDPAQDGQDLTNLEALMGEYGMTANDGVVIEGDTANYALGSPFYLLPNLESHSITSPLQEGGYYILLALAQGITVEESPRDGLTVESLLTTSDAAYSKIAGYSMETYSKEEGDIDGPFSLAAIATDTLEDGSESHVIWVGSTSLLDDQYNQQVSGANQDFFLNCVDLRRGGRGLHPRQTDHHRVPYHERVHRLHADAVAGGCAARRLPALRPADLDQEETPMTTMTRGKKLFVLLLALVILTGVTLLVAHLVPDEDESTAEDTSYIIFSLDPDQVTQLSWTYEDSTVTLTKDENSNWSYPDDEAFPLDASYPDAMVQALKEVSATKTIESPENLADYGLEEAACAISVPAGDSTYELRIGDETGLGGQRYLSLGDGNVYLVDADLLEDFSLGLYDIVSMESIPSMTDLTSVSIETTSGTLTLDYLEDSGLAYSDQYTWFWNQDGEETPLDTDLTEDLVSTVTGLTWNACVDYQADEDSLGTYGLDIPAATITVEYTESTQVETNETDENGDPIYETQETPATFVLELGDYDGDTCYARISGSSMVYRVDGTVADTLLAAKGEDLLPQDVVLIDWSDVTSVEINLDGTTYSLEKTVQEETDEDGNTTETYVYQLDGQTVDITDALDSIQDLEVTGSDADATPGTEELAFTFYQDKENFPTVTLVFSQYDSSSCLVTLNGESRLLVSRTDLLDLVDTLQDLLAE